MTKRVVYNVVPAGNGDWAVKKTGGEKASAVLENKVDAIERAKELAKENPLSQVRIKGQDGKIQTEYTYGKDPYPPKG